MYFVWLEEGEYSFDIIYRKYILPALTLIAIFLDVATSVDIFVFWKAMLSEAYLSQLEVHIAQSGRLKNNQSEEDRLHDIQLLEKELTKLKDKCDKYEETIKHLQVDLECQE